MTDAEGFWLGIDVGSSPGKVLSFALIRADGAGATSVAFERGAVRGTERGSWPRSALELIDLEQPGLLSASVTTGINSILDRSTLVREWLAAVAGGRVACGAAVDGPCGFAEGASRRATEAAAVTSHGTPTLAELRGGIERFVGARNEAPLFQRYIWKLVGMRVLHQLAERAQLAEPDTVSPAVAELCVSPAAERRAFLREAFPSDLYARTNGRLGVFSTDARALLLEVAASTWTFLGNLHGRTSSVPTPEMQRRLLSHRRALLADLRSDGAPVPRMKKIVKDPSWADLWDALACAFVTCFESRGCACWVLGGQGAAVGEGAILGARWLVL